jgi:hypothetical protein
MQDFCGEHGAVTDIELIRAYEISMGTMFFINPVIGCPSLL